ncbi:helix-turn-helix transcriptional regulator [Nocardia cyriacigeorgica]|uniref:helix-turn-helix domain-containing protein n=1 Tax=Nocardia cyriacigeorgica TaxID=135487 RepID=UPI0018958D05|nr:XRE family transcriptional regulator [Nocardia cyriacigeorgica]MBF6101547.1 helix-turn-helix transcriptional regulator [Nocardia cyriacigeorgica]
MNLEALGERVHRARRTAHLTLAEAAARSDVSVSMISAIERGEKAPTVVVLDRIARGLGVDLAMLVTGDDRDRLVLRRAADHDVAQEGDGWTRRVLTPVVPGVNFEWMEITLPAGCDAGEFPAYAPNSHEFVYVAEGTLTVDVGEESRQVGAGDTLYFEADVPHRFSNPTTSRCRYFIAAMIMRARTPGSRGQTGAHHPDRDLPRSGS